MHQAIRAEAFCQRAELHVQCGHWQEPRAVMQTEQGWKHGGSDLIYGDSICNALQNFNDSQIDIKIAR